MPMKLNHTLIALSIIALFPIGALADLNEDLMAYYPFNSNAKDESGNGHDAVVSGSGATLTEDRFGTPNSAYRFNGERNSSIIADNYAWTIEGLTLSTWIYVDEVDSLHDVIVFGWKNEPAQFFYLGTHDNEKLRFRAEVDWNDGVNWMSDFVVPTKQWIHIAVVWDGGDAPDSTRIFVDGTELVLNHLLNGAGLTRKLSIDRIHLGLRFSENDYGNEQTFTGILDDTRLYNSVLSDDKIGELFTEGSDPDSDGDGVPDNQDLFPLDPDEWMDSDGDGVGDNGDVFPHNPNECADTDGDGVGNNGDAFPDDPDESVDSDGDGVGDNGDAFPEDSTEWADTDGDGVGDNGDIFPEDPDEWADADGDGVGNNSDVFPEDPDESADTDGDGVGDNGDVFPEDPDESADIDGDGVGDNADQNDESDLRETVFVGGAETGGSDTGVPNQVDDSGLSIQDKINDIEADDYRNHGQYVRTVAHLVDELLDAGLITEDEACDLQSAAAKSDIGKPKKGKKGGRKGGGRR